MKIIPNITGPMTWSLGSQSTKFDVQHEVGDQIQLSFTVNTNLDPKDRCRFILFQFGDGNTYIETKPNVSRTFTFNTQGTTTVKVIGQPSFAGVTEATLRGPINASKLDLSLLSDITDAIIREARDGSNIIGAPFGTLSKPLPTGVDSVYLRTDLENTLNAALADASGATSLTYFSVNITDTLNSLAGSETHVVLNGCSGISDTTTGSHVSSSLEVWDTQGTVGITVDLAVFVGLSSLQAIQANQNPNSFIDSGDSIKQILKQNSALEEFGIQRSGQTLSAVVGGIPFDVRGALPVVSTDIKMIALGDDSQSASNAVPTDYWFDEWEWASKTSRGGPSGLTLVINQSIIGNLDASLSALSTAIGGGSDYDDVTLAMRRRAVSRSQAGDDAVYLPVRHDRFSSIVAAISSWQFFGRSTPFEATSYSESGGTATLTPVQVAGGEAVTEFANYNSVCLMEGTTSYGPFAASWDGLTLTLTQAIGAGVNDGPVPPASFGAGTAPTVWGINQNIA